MKDKKKSSINFDCLHPQYLDLRFPRRAAQTMENMLAYKLGHRIDPNADSIGKEEYEVLLDTYNNAQDPNTVPDFPPFYQPGLMEHFHDSNIDCLVRSNRAKNSSKSSAWPCYNNTWEAGHAVKKVNRLCHRRDLRKLVNSSDNIIINPINNTTFILGPQNISPYTQKGLIRDVWDVAFELGFPNHKRVHNIVGLLNSTDGIMNIHSVNDGYYFAYPNQFIINWGTFVGEEGNVLDYDEIRQLKELNCFFNPISQPENYRSHVITKKDLIQRLEKYHGYDLSEKEADNVWYNLSETCTRQNVTSFWNYGLPNLQLMMPLVVGYGLNSDTGQIEKQLRIFLGYRDVAKWNESKSDFKVKLAEKLLSSQSTSQSTDVEIESESAIIEYSEEDEIDSLEIKNEEDIITIKNEIPQYINNNSD